MDGRSWLWRRKNSEKNQSIETESSGSVSSHSERFSDDQSLSNPNAQSPEVTSKAVDCNELNDSVKSLSEKLSEAIAEIREKEDSVKQHAKVAEEAVSGWERAENEVLVLKKQVEGLTQKKSTLEERVDQLDGALKECLRRLRQAREEQEDKIYEALVKKSSEWESKKSQLENQIVNLHSQLQNAKADTMGRDLSTRAAEAASKQHLDSLKKVAKLEAECRRLKLVAQKASSIYAESVTESHSDCGEKMVICENDVRKFKTACERSFAVPSTEIDLMDDFLEMERLAACPDPLRERNDDETWVNQGQNGELEFMMNGTGELEGKLMVMEKEKFNLESDLNECRIRLMTSEEQLKQARVKLVEVSTELTRVNEAKRAAEKEVEFTKVNSVKVSDEAELTVAQVQNQLMNANEAKIRADVELKNVNVKKTEAESKLKEMEHDLQTMRSRIGSLQKEVDKERSFSCEALAKCEKLDSQVQRSAVIDEFRTNQDQELAMAASKFSECQKTIASLGRQLESLANFSRTC